MDKLRSELEGIVSTQWVSSKLPDRIAYSRDQWPRTLVQLRQKQLQHLPEFVVWPEDAEQAAKVLEICHRHKALLCATGGGSSVTGASIPHRGGVVVDLKRLSRIRWINSEDGLAEVEGGIIGIHLEEALQRAGHTLGHFPSSIMCSTLGGWAATRSAGQASSRYGKIEDLVIDVEMARPDGTLTWCKHHYDITQLVMGSEGTMGLITACRIQLYPAPKARQFRGVLFPTLETGLTAMRQLMQETTPPPTIMRLYDPLDSFISSHRKAKKSSDAVQSLVHPHMPPPGTDSQALVAYQPKKERPKGRIKRLMGTMRNRLVAKVLQHTDRGLPILEKLLPSQSLLILGYEEQTEEEAKRLMQQALTITAKNNGKDLGEGPGLHWFHGRYNTSFKQSQVFQLGAFSDTMEVASSWSDLLPMYQAVRSAIRKDALVVAHFSHAYVDGCSIYFSFAGYDDPETEVDRYDRIWRNGLQATHNVGGTISHHHGVGINKAPAMLDELGQEGARLLRHVQATMGDTELLNPGKLLPMESPYKEVSPRPTKEASPPPPSLDSTSLILRVDARHSLETIESFANIHECSAGFRAGFDLTLQQWIEQQEPWAVNTSYANAYQRLYGLTATLPSGDHVALGLAPRTSAGPDLRSIFWQTHGCLGTVDEVLLRLHRQPSKLEHWKILLPTVESGIHFLRDLAHQQRRPEDALLTFSPKGNTQYLFLTFDPEQTPHITDWVQSQIDNKPMLSFPAYPHMFQPNWLGIQVQWSRLHAVVNWLREQQYPIDVLALMGFTHTTATLLCSFSFSSAGQYAEPPHHNIARNICQAFPPEQEGGCVEIWSKERKLSQQPGVATEVFHKLKQKLDPGKKLPSFPEHKEV